MDDGIWINAVVDRDIGALLESYGALHAVENGKHRCAQYSITIDLANIGLIRITDGIVTIVCTDSVCLETYLHQKE